MFNAHTMINFLMMIIVMLVVNAIPPVGTHPLFIVVACATFNLAGFVEGQKRK